MSAVDRVLNVIVRWLEEHPELPEAIRRKIIALEYAQDRSNKAYQMLLRSVGEYVERQRILKTELGTFTPMLRDFGKKAMDISALQWELARALGAPESVMERIISKALPQIGKGLSELGVMTGNTKNLVSKQLQGMGIIAQGLADQLEGVSAPQIMKAFTRIRDITGLTSADIIKSFYVAYIAQKRIEGLMGSTAEETAQHFIDSGKLIKAAEQATTKTEELTAEDREKIAKRIAEARKTGIRNQIEAMRRGLSALSPIYEKLVTAEEFLRGIRDKTSKVTKESFEERSKAARKMAKEIVAEQEKMTPAIMEGGKVALTAADLQAAAEGKITPAMAAVRKKYEEISKKALEAGKAVQEQSDVTDTAQAIMKRFGLSQAQAADIADYFVGKTNVQLDRIKFLGRTYDETTDMYYTLMNKQKAGLSELMDFTYNYVQSEIQAKKAVDSVASSLIKSGGVLDDNAKKQWEIAKGVYGWKEALDRVGRAMRKQLLSTKKAGDATDGLGRRISRGVKHLERMGIRSGWLAYRLVILGRIITRYMTNVIRKAINTLIDWQNTTEGTATAIGLLAATGELTGDRLAYLQGILTQLPTIGMQVQGAFLYLQSTAAGLALAFGPAFQRIFLVLGDILRQLQPIIVSEVVPAIMSLTYQLVQLAPAILEMARTAIPAFVAGVSFIIPILINFFNALQPFIPIISALLGVFAPLAPLLMVVGTTMYFVSTIVTGLSATITVLSKVIFGATVLERMFQIAILKRAVAQDAATIAATRAISVLQRYAFALTLIIGIIASVLALYSLWTKRSKDMSKETRKLTSAYEKFSKNATKSLKGLKDAYVDHELAFTGMATAILNSQGELMYTIDTYTGKVYDASGNVVATYDQATGQIVDMNGNVIGSFDSVSGVLTDTQGNIEGFATNVSSSLSSISSSLGDIATSLSDLQDSVEGLDLTIDTSDFEEAMQGIEDSIKSTSDQFLILMGVMSAVQIGLQVFSGAMGAGAASTALTGLVGALGGVGTAASVVAGLVAALAFSFYAASKPVEDQNRFLADLSNTMADFEEHAQGVMQNLGKQQEAFNETSQSIEEYGGILDDQFKRSPLPEFIDWTKRQTESIERFRTQLDETARTVATYGYETSRLRGAVPTPAVTAMAGPAVAPTQYITIPVTVEIGTVTSEVDINELIDRINEGIATRIAEVLGGSRP